MRRLADRAVIAGLIAQLAFAGCTIIDTRSAQSYYAKGDYERASDEYLAYIQENPNSPLVPDAFIGLAWSRYQMKEYYRSLEAAEIMRGRYPGHHMVPTAGYIVAMSHFSQRKFTEASNELRNLILNYPRDPIVPEARFLLARSEAGSLRYASADRNYEAYLAEFGNSAYAPAALLGRADVLIKLAKYQEAEGLLAAFIEKFPGHPDRPGALVLLATLTSATGRYEDAASYLERMLAENPGAESNRAVWEQLAGIYVGLHRQDKAAGIYRQLLDSAAPGNRKETARLTATLASHYADLNDTENARRFYREVAGQSSADPAIRADAMRWLFSAEIAEGRTGAALEYGERFLAQFPNHIHTGEILKGVVDLYVAGGRVADGRDRLAGFIRADKAAAVAQDYLRLANLNIELGEYDHAAVEAKEGVERARRAGDTPAIASGLYTLMIIQGLQEDIPEAVRNYWALKEADPDYISASEKVYWDAVEEKFYAENRVPIASSGRKNIDAAMKIHVAVAGIEFTSVDSASVGLATSLWRVLAASIGSRREFQFVAHENVRFMKDLISRLDFAVIPDSYYPLRSNIGADWIVHGEITRDMGAPDARSVVLRLRLLRIDYNGVFPFEYTHRFTQEAARTAAPEIARDIVEKLVLYRPER